MLDIKVFGQHFPSKPDRATQAIADFLASTKSG
jgi:hypothetical protein